MRFASAVPLAIVLLVGAVKVALGVSREKPVFYLLLLVAGVAVALYFVGRRVFRTSAGDAALDQLRQQHASLATTTLEAHPHPRHDMGYAFGLFGLGMLGGVAATGLSDMFPTLRRRPDGTWVDNTSNSWGSGGGDSSSSGCSSASCSGSSCGSSCGGGGGCGGCGGGGD